MFHNWSSFKKVLLNIFLYCKISQMQSPIYQISAKSIIPSLLECKSLISFQWSINSLSIDTIILDLNMVISINFCMQKWKWDTFLLAQYRPISFLNSSVDKILKILWLIKPFIYPFMNLSNIFIHYKQPHGLWNLREWQDCWLS